MEYQVLIGEINKNLYAATGRLAQWLYRSFKKNPNYWQDFVLAKLSDNQRTIVVSKGWRELSDLDLAALLRIADRNWYELLRIYSNLTHSDRDVIRAVANARNRWAHCGSVPYTKEQILVDLHAIRDFFKIIGVDANAKTEIRGLIRSVSGETTIAIETYSEPIPQAAVDVTTLQVSLEVNSIVRLKSDIYKTGVVLSLVPVGDTIKYNVFIDNGISQYFADQIELVVPDRADKASTLDDLLRTMTAKQLSPPSANNLFSLDSARIDFVPYQFRPALKLIKSDPPHRLLIADGVGVGKTIEAGLIIKELAARSPLETIIIICPRPLVAEKKWEREMREKFGEDFQSANSGLLRQLIRDYERDGVWDERYNRLIIPYSILTEELLNGMKGRNAHSGLLKLDPPPFFDLLIVDEAHHIRNSDTQAHKVVKYFTEHSDSVLYLTATPIQLGNNDLYTLLNLLFPDLVIDKAVFNAMAEPNEHINSAIKYLRAGAGHEVSARESLMAVGGTEWGRRVIVDNPAYKNLLQALSGGELTREMRVRLISEAESLHSFANAINRTRRQDIEDFCVRRAITHKSVFTKKQQELHDELLNFVATVMSVLHPTITLKFLMCTIRRQAASCIFGLAPFIEEIVKKSLNHLSFNDDEFEESEDELDFEKIDFGKFEQLAKRLIDLSKSLTPDDPKFDTLAHILKEREKSQSGKTMIFSTFRHTLRYLKERIRKLGLRVELIDGSVKDEERNNLRTRFALPRENPNAVDVLLFSEVGSEGLDYQFCDAMVNYDLPWNPMRIEQRIGRIDRRGQKSETVQVFNCITKGTIDYEIHERCYNRIGIFEKSLGECSEILGKIEERIKNIIFDSRLTDAERADKIEKMADNAVRRIEEDARLESASKDMFGINLTASTDDIEKADSPWLSQTAIKRMINGYLSERLDNTKLFLTDNGLSLSIDEKKTIFDDYKLLDRKWLDKAWENYLRSSKAIHLISLSVGDPNRKNVLLTLSHPLVRQAANYYSRNANLQISLTVFDLDIPSGEYPFSLYAWEYKGYRPRTEFVIVCQDGINKSELLNNISNAVLTNKSLSGFENTLAEQELEHMSLWRSARDAFVAEVNMNYTYKIASLEKSVNARKLIAQQQLSETDSSKIEIMRRSQIERLESDFEIKKRRYQKSAETADIIATLLVSGVISVQK